MWKSQKKDDKKAVESIIKGKVSDFKRFRKGYVNNNYIFSYNQKIYFAKVPRFHVNDWDSEAIITKKFFKNSKLDASRGIVIREWVDGENVITWDKKKLSSIETQIRKLQRLKAPNKVIKHNWTLYNEHANHLDIGDFKAFETLVRRYKKDKRVLSHNDINRENVVWDGKKITLIDFEWANLNNEYFDYASFYIAEGIKLKTKNETKFNNVIFMSTCYFLMWSYSMPRSIKVSKLRKHYKNLLNNKPWLK